MKRQTLVLVVLVLAVLASGCDAFSSAPPPAPPAPPGTGSGSAPAPAPVCNSRLWGKMTNTTTKTSPGNAAIQISSGTKTVKTITDPNGLYGFAGLCAGEYTITFTPPGAKEIVHPDKIKIDGQQPIKVDLNFK